MRAFAAVLLLPLLAPAARAEEPEPLDLTRATVLASPGVPEALLPFLPAAPQPLRWPLPDGPVLLLGLPERDALAREVGEALGVLAADEDLAGGYVVSAWADGQRPVAAILAADAAALFAARFELSCEAPGGAGDRTAEVAGEGACARTTVPAGRRAVRPAWRERALEVPAPPRDDVALRAAGARANRLWLPAHPTQAAWTLDVAGRAARFGIETGWTSFVAPMAMDPSDELAAAQARAASRRFALVFPWTPEFSGTWARLARDAAERLRPGGLDQLLVRPPPGGDPSALREIPEAELLWWGPTVYARTVAREDATAAVERAGAPVHLVETWGQERQDEDVGVPPSMPRGRDPRLGEVLQGILVSDGPLAEAILARAFDPAAAGPGDAADALLPHVPFGRLPPAEVLRGTARSLRAAVPGTGGLAPWMPAYADRLDSWAEHLPPEEAVLVVPTVPEGIELDGRLDDRAWAYAAARTLAGVTLLAASDGRALRLALRIPGDDPGFEVRLAGQEGDVEAWSLRLSAGTVVRAISLAPHEPAEDHVRVVRGDGDGTVVFEIDLDRVALLGDAFPTRVLRFAWDVRRGGGTASFAPGGFGVLLVGR